MPDERSRQWVLTWTGLLTWAAIGLPFSLIWRHALRSGSGPLLIASAVAYAVFGIAYFLVTTRSRFSQDTGRRSFLLVIEIVSALVMTYSARTGFEPIFLVIVAAQLAYCMPIRAALLWAGLQNAALAWIYLHGGASINGVIQILVFVTFQGFALYTGYVAERESAQRMELARLNAELRSTQELLGESSRLAERTRISRDLHDVLGHHLTALSLALEVASHRTEGPGREEVERARSITRLLLADVRGVVSQFREDDSIDLVPALRALAEGIVRPAIRIEIGPDVRIADPAVAEALLRIAQEAVTNAVKHAKAPTLTLSLTNANGEIVFVARDDGLGAAATASRGHGLQGIRERVAEHKGRMLIDTKPGGGFGLEIRIPQASEGTG
jgi:signal transduction histidine kinase